MDIRLVRGAETVENDLRGVGRPVRKGVVNGIVREIVDGGSRCIDSADVSRETSVRDALLDDQAVLWRRCTDGARTEQNERTGERDNEPR
ncbi:MAG: hypothetical protein H0W33_06410 [Gammaproteobacteria bacterium]|nr:hypothetical protein [Gammaproteobacteria bacterium]